MDNWVVLGLLASLGFGTYAVVAKVVTSQNYFGIPSNTAGLLMLVGVALVFGAYFLLGGKTEIPFDKPLPLALGILTGVLYAGAMVAVFIATSQGAEISKLAPLYNTNTLVAVFLGIVLLKEAPDSAAGWLKVVGGAVLITLGGIVLSL